jgi:hypothetical protein
MSHSPEQSESLGLRITRNQAAEYEEIVIQQSREACRCRDCESTIKLGVQVFDWIVDLDEDYRRDLFAGKGEYDKSLESDLEVLLRGWHRRCAEVIAWAEENIRLGFEVSNLDQFRDRCEQAKAMVASLDKAKNGNIMSEPLITLRDQALEDYRNGQTAEFF